jgi:6-pyruvoyltetrahydropterin/6-carboxytetrahydropterin synthase
MYELSKTFVFDAAHTLNDTTDPEATRRIHGHSYWAEVTIRGTPHPETGMIIDLGVFEKRLNEIRSELDHRFLNEVPNLDPVTVENLCAWIWTKLSSTFSTLHKITISRKSFNNRCTYYGPETGLS